ncbi:MAG TPA: BTAD domain-containing putative transcriptional regulator [Solirubrobacteraceae bacterium]|nr:BTAD domain-containing putative transcriptional regulator [Solirubrobacteraceae bacterium]
MGRLPSHHVPRPRLTDRCRGEDVVVVVVEAAAGYGKSVLAAELVEVWGSVGVEALLEEGGVSAELLAARLRAAVSRAGFLDAAASMTAAGADPAGAVDAMLAGLKGEACAIVIDDAHHATRDAGALIDRIASLVTPPQRLVVLARRLPEGAQRLRRAEAVQLGAGELALRPDETLELAHAGFGLEVSGEEGRLLDAVTGGWTAAAVLAMSRAKRTDQPLRAVARPGANTDRGGDAVGAMLEELIVALGPDRRHLAQIAPLALLDRELLAAVTGDEGFFERALGLGLPLTRTDARWWRLPGPVRDHLATLGPLDPAALTAAAAYYARHGELGAALQLLLAAGQSDAAARLLADADPAGVAGVDTLELLAVLDRLPGDVLDRFPGALLVVARSCQAAAMLAGRARIMARLTQTVKRHGTAALRRAVDVELATDLVTDGNQASEAEAIARRVLEAAPSAELVTRARALSVVGRAAYWRRGPDGHLPVSAMEDAAAYLAQAAKLFLEAGDRAAAGGLAPYRAMWIELDLGRPLAALEILDEGLTLVANHPRRVGFVQCFRAQVLVYLGRHDESEAASAEVARIAGRLGDRHLAAYAHWELLRSCSIRGDAAAALHHAQQAEASRADWWAVAGQDFLAEAADYLDLVGHVALASEYLERANSMPGDADATIAMADCALLSRHGDPELARERLAVVHRHGIPPREYWRVTLLEAYAALRCGDSGAGGLAARAFEEAARLGQPQFPLILEREVTESLLALAAQTGSPAALALQSASLPVALSVLGRFELARGGRPVSLGAGQSAQLLKLVAVSGGRIHAERAIETLWPDVAPGAGRNRLRTVLGRLREVAPDTIARDGDQLALAAEVRLDLAQFHSESGQALALGIAAGSPAVALARSAIARYRGDLLPDDLYEAWADAAREDTRRKMLDLLDLCAAAAAQRGDLDEARRMVERTIELAPYDDDRYLKVASILHEQGRRGAALSVLRRARSTLAQLGVPLPAELRDFEETLVA